MFEKIDISTIINISLLLFFLIPLLLFIYLYFHDKSQSQHAVLRNFPILGRIRYLLEMLGPEFRQYLFDSDSEGKPFNRSDFSNIVVQGKYLKTVIGLVQNVILISRFIYTKFNVP